MRSIPSLESLKEPFSHVKKVLVLLTSTANVDVVSAALGLSCALRAKGLDVQVACSADMRVEFSRLVGVDTVKKKIGNRNLVISLPSGEGKVEKVSYVETEDKSRLELIIAPKIGVSPIDPTEVRYEYAGAETDATFLVGVNSYQDISELYDAEQNVIEGSLTVALTHQPVGTYAKYHADASEYSSVSEMVAVSTLELGLAIDEDGASNFLFGIESATDSLRGTTMSADTFEMVAYLLRAGGHRQPIGQQGVLTPNQFPYVAHTAQPTTAFATALSGQSSS